MFEDSTFESTGRIRTRSRGWMMAAFLFNGSILLALILIPLVYPEALPRQLMSILIEAAPVPPQMEKPKPEPQRPSRDLSELDHGRLVAPPGIPPRIHIVAIPEPPMGDNPVAGVPDLGQEAQNVSPSIFAGHAQPAVVHPSTGPVQVTSRIAEGMLLQKVMPLYPVIAKATRKEGTVVLQATISTGGTIENLRVVSGDQMLIQAAMEAVRNWRYRPYLLNGKPVEVETTVNVVFKLTQ